MSQYPINNNEDLTILGSTNFRAKKVKFGIKKNDRKYHMYVIGKSGTGKSTLIENMCFADISKNHGLAIIDPHGELADKIMNYIPKERVKDVVYFNPADIDWPIAFNIIEQVPNEQRHLVSSGLMAVFKKIWPDVWSARMEYILNNAILALLEYPGATLLSINRMLSDDNYRKEVISKVNDPTVKAFWTNEFDKYDPRFRREAVAPIQNKVGQFISNPLIRNIIGQQGSNIDPRKIMDDGKILIVNLSKGLTGEENTTLLGALIVTKIQLAAMSRADMPPEQRKAFYLYIDEFQTFSTESFANILSEARKYNLSLILTHQYIKQLSEEVKDAVFGNVGGIISFRIGPDDAGIIEKQFHPDFDADDLINIPNYHFYIKYLIDGMPTNSFSAKGEAPLPDFEISYKNEIIEQSRATYANFREEVEKDIKKWSALEFASSSFNNYPQTKTEYWEIVCSKCKKPSLVPFRPDPSKLVYCSECFEQVKEKKKTLASESSEHSSSRSFNQPYPKAVKPKENCFDNAHTKNNVDMERKRKEIKDKIDNQGLSDIIKNIFKK